MLEVRVGGSYSIGGRPMAAEAAVGCGADSQRLSGGLREGLA